MRVLIATGLYPPDIGGPATYSKLLHDELPKRGIEVDVVSFREVRQWPKGIRHFLYYWKVLRAGKQADILYAQDPVSVGLPTMKAAQKLGKPFVLKIVGDYAWEQGTQRFGVTDTLDVFASQTTRYHSQVIRLKNVQQKVATAARKIVVPSKYLKKIVMQWGIPEEKLEVVYNGFTPPQRVSAQELEGAPALVSVGRLVSWKGFGTLIELMPKVLEQFPKSSLYIIGGGPDKEKLRDLIQKHKLEPSVHLFGKIPHEKLLQYLAGADLFVLNTGYEGLSHLILEAMAVGTPVVTTTVGGNSEIITNEERGLLVAYNDKEALSRAIFRMLSDNGLRERMVVNAQKSVRKFSKERMLNETITLLQNI